MDPRPATPGAALWRTSPPRRITGSKEAPLPGDRSPRAPHGERSHHVKATATTPPTARATCGHTTTPRTTIAP